MRFISRLATSLSGVGAEILTTENQLGRGVLSHLTPSFQRFGHSPDTVTVWGD